MPFLFPNTGKKIAREPLHWPAGMKIILHIVRESAPFPVGKQKTKTEERKFFRNSVYGIGEGQGNDKPFFFSPIPFENS
jgi:hypothetical protein